jgi:DNA-binding response OmpR family regulator
LIHAQPSFPKYIFNRRCRAEGAFVSTASEYFCTASKEYNIGNIEINQGIIMTKVMIVDDEKEATDLLENLLKLEGYESISVNDSTTATQIANTYNPDIFLLDLMMPEIDGFRLCRLLRADPKFTHTPIIIITALNDNDSRVVAYGAGANDYLTKPYFLHELASRIKSLIHKTE